MIICYDKITLSVVGEKSGQALRWGELINSMLNMLNTLKNIITGQKQVSQQAKLQAVSISITIVHAIMFLLFIHFSVWPMVIYNGIVVVYYLITLRIVQAGKIMLGYIMTFLEIAFQVIFGTIMLGWDVGFFMYVFAILPLFFYLNLLNDNYERSVVPPLIETFGAAVVFVTSYVISIHFTPRFILGVHQVHALFLYNSILAILLLAAMSHFFIIERRISLQQMTNRNRKLGIEASEDPLTKLTNRRSMEKHLALAMENAAQSGSIFSLVMGDIDFFKRVNDTYGHDFGDVVLKTVADMLRESVREEDVVCRWGGEEFLILIRGDKDEADFVSERIRRRIEEIRIQHNGQDIGVTITLGVSSYVPGKSIEQLIAKADANLYYGKQNGRNRVFSPEG